MKFLKALAILLSGPLLGIVVALILGSCFASGPEFRRERRTCVPWRRFSDPALSLHQSGGLYPCIDLAGGSGSFPQAQSSKSS